VNVYQKKEKMSMSDKEVVTFGKEAPSSETEAYKAKVSAIKSAVSAVKGSEPVGSVPRPEIPLLSRSELPEVSGLTPHGGVKPRPPGSALLSQETAEQLAAFKDAQAEEEASEKKAEKPEKLETEELLKLFDFDRRSEAEKIYDNEERRKRIEERCEPMDLGDLIELNELRQRIPIVPGKFEVTFRSVTGYESQFIKKYLARDMSIQSEAYYNEKISLCTLACAITALNNSPIVHHLDVNGEVDEEIFEKKLKLLLRKPIYILADMGVNYDWFDKRARQLTTRDHLGNG
jgi:hypothetical protein